MRHFVSHRKALLTRWHSRAQFRLDGVLPESAAVLAMNYRALLRDHQWESRASAFPDSEVSQGVKPLLDHPLQYGNLLRLETEFGLRYQQMGALGGKPCRSVIYGQPRRIHRAVLPHPLSTLPFAMMLQQLVRDPAFVISARNGWRHVNDT